MISIKKGVEVNGIRPEMIIAIIIASQVYTEYGVDFVLTEATGGKHGHASLHYVGFAIDIRTRDMSRATAEVVVEKIKKALGDQYDVVLESDHIHIEFQPK